MKHLFLYLSLVAGSIACQACNRVQDDTGGAFAYCEIYLPEGVDAEGAKLGLNNVSEDWGIWGHHLSLALPDNPPPSVYATVDGRINKEQFCFSSDRLYDCIVDYITDRFGESHTQRFAILPNDNSLSCQCEQCIAKGCSTANASPAVLALLERLAKRFPKHLFFTSDYLTTREIATRSMPKNTGVLISAIGYSLCAGESPSEEIFSSRLLQWSHVTQNIYVWDYINNFDDYFTPYPVFSVMQRRFQLYDRFGVQGVFLNGSGHDWSTFSRLKTHVLAALLHDPACDWREVLTEKCHEFYPVCGDRIARYIISQEDWITQRNVVLPLYEGVAVSRRCYLNEDEFLQFHNDLLQLSPQADDSERAEVSLITRAMMLTRLELMRLRAQTNGVDAWLDQLASVVNDGARIYSESYWTVESYVSDYRAMLQEVRAMAPKNRLQGLLLTPLTALDDEYHDIAVLTDGLPGLPSNYHCGQMLSSADPALRIAIPRVGDLRHLRVGLTSNVQFHIALPLRVQLMAGDSEIATVVPTPGQGMAQRVTVDFDIPASLDKTLTLTIVRNKEERTMAVDEIMGW